MKQIQLLIAPVRTKYLPHMKTLVYTVALTIIANFTFAQNVNEFGSVTSVIVVDGDTIPLLNFPEFTITQSAREQITFTSKRQERKYNKLEKDVITVYPYAKLAGEMLVEYDKELAKIDNRKQKKEFTERVEKELDEEFGSELSDLSISQAVILIKLVDRQTGNTSYEILQDYRGYFTAFVWQGLARLFGHNLKSEYDETEDDWMIEAIIDDIENGHIAYTEIKR